MVDYDRIWFQFLLQWSLFCIIDSIIATIFYPIFVSVLYISWFLRLFFIMSSDQEKSGIWVLVDQEKVGNSLHYVFLSEKVSMLSIVCGSQIGFIAFVTTARHLLSSPIFVSRGHQYAAVTVCICQSVLVLNRCHGSRLTRNCRCAPNFLLKLRIQNFRNKVGISSGILIGLLVDTLAY